MNLKELRDRIEEDLYPVQVAPDEVLRRINEEHDFISRELRIPRASWDGVVPSSTLNFEPPQDVRTTGIHIFYEEENGTPHRVLTVAQADGRHPGWRDNTFDCKLIVHDAAMDDASFVFRGFADTELLTFVGVMKPNDLETNSDTPFDGEFDEFHELIAIKVVADILKAEGRRMQYEGKIEQGNILLDWSGDEMDTFDKEMKKAFARVWDYDSFNLGGMA